MWCSELWLMILPWRELYIMNAADRAGKYAIKNFCSFLLNVMGKSEKIHKTCLSHIKVQNLPEDLLISYQPSLTRISIQCWASHCALHGKKHLSTPFYKGKLYQILNAINNCANNHSAYYKVSTAISQPLLAMNVSLNQPRSVTLTGCNYR